MSNSSDLLVTLARRHLLFATDSKHTVKKTRAADARRTGQDNKLLPAHNLRCLKKHVRLNCLSVPQTDKQNPHMTAEELQEGSGNTRRGGVIRKKLNTWKKRNSQMNFKALWSHLPTWNIPTSCLCGSRDPNQTQKTTEGYLTCILVPELHFTWCAWHPNNATTTAQNLENCRRSGNEA